MLLVQLRVYPAESITMRILPFAEGVAKFWARHRIRAIEPADRDCSGRITSRTTHQKHMDAFL